MQLLIPGRPQSKPRNSQGTDLAAAHAYTATVRAAATTAGLGRNGHPHTPNGHLRVDITLIYTSDHDVPPTAWPTHSIPNADTAPTLVLKALTGLAWTHATQANPLIVTRRVITRHECQRLYGNPDGATLIEIEG